MTASTSPKAGRGGRPRKEAAEKRTAGVLVKFTPAERDRLAAEVEAHGVASLVELIRQRALKGRVQVVRRTELAGPDRVELNRLGVNLHQLVKHLNIAGGGRQAVADIERDARQAVEEINALLLRGAGDGAEPL